MKQTIFFLSNLTVFLCYGFLSHAQGKRGDNMAGLEHMQIRTDFNKYFDSCGVAGSTVIYDVAAQQWIVSDTVGINRETLPASTFKIINLLIALETNAIKDEHELIPWLGTTDTVKYGFRPDIYHDMSVKEAFELSAGWVFVSLAHTIGVETYRKYLLASGYGNGNLTHSDIDFWNFGGFGISPVNQVAFLYGLYNETLPFSQRNMRIVKDVMVTEKAEDYTIRAKTGWTREHNINTGWWTGFIETPKGCFVFATRLLQDRKQNRADFGRCRMDITRCIFRD